MSIAIQKFEEDVGAESFLRNRNAYAPLSETISNARNIYFVGPSLINVFSLWAKYLHSVKLNQQGATICLLLLDPQSHFVDSAALCLMEPVESLRSDIIRTISYVETMLNEGIKSGSIEVRIMRGYPNLSMVLIDPNESNGKIFVEFIGYQAKIHARPHIELMRRRDGIWYEHFLETYRQLWKDSRVRLTSQR